MEAMSSLFRKRKTPEQVVALLSAALAGLDANEGDEVATLSLREEIAKRVAQAKAFIYGDVRRR